MKIAVFSDIHGNSQALEAILNDIKSRDIDEIYSLGDVIGLGPNPKECLDLLIEMKVKMVLGNHELYYLRGTGIDDEMDEEEKKHQKWVKESLYDKHYYFLNACPLVINKKVNNINISFQHFLLNPNSHDVYPFDSLKIVNEDLTNIINALTSNITFIGHEHKPFEFSKGNKKIIDVGSSGCNETDDTFYTVLTIEDNMVSVEKKYIKYDRERFEQIIKNIDYPEKKLINEIFFKVNLNI